MKTLEELREAGWIISNQTDQLFDHVNTKVSAKVVIMAVPPRRYHYYGGAGDTIEEAEMHLIQHLVSEGVLEPSE